MTSFYSTYLTNNTSATWIYRQIHPITSVHLLKITFSLHVDDSLLQISRQLQASCCQGSIESLIFSVLLFQTIITGIDKSQNVIYNRLALSAVKADSCKSQKLLAPFMNGYSLPSAVLFNSSISNTFCLLSEKEKIKTSLLYKYKPLMSRNNNYQKIRAHYNFRKRTLILSNDIETNPGPRNNSYPGITRVKNSSLLVLTYNIRGLKDIKKLVRFRNFISTSNLKNNCVINLQETHFNQHDIAKVNTIFNVNSLHSLSIGTSGGTSIMYHKSFFDEIVEEKTFDCGRMCSLTAKKGEDLYYFLNIYAPTNYNDKLSFMNRLEEELTITFNKFPEATSFISGDFNLVLNPALDSINRGQTNNELKATKLLKDIMIKYGLIDTYRTINSYGGFTWGRDNPTYIRSRLDYILSNKSLKHALLGSNVYITPNESDHSLVISEFDISNIDFGPGIIRANSEVLNDAEICKKNKG